MNDLLQNFERHPLFRRLGRPVAPDTVLHPYSYVMRSDGTFVFLVASMRVDGEDLWFGEPVRLPKPPGYEGRARDELLFDRPYLNVMKIFEDGTVDTGQDVQAREIDAIVAHATSSVAPLRRTPLQSGAIFTRDEIVWTFEFSAALDWVLERATPLLTRAMAWVEERGLPRERLGLTGGSLVGLEEEDDEDVDLVFKGPMDFLLSVRDEIRRGIAEGRYRPIEQFGKVWSLRVWLDDETQLCPFFVVDPPGEGPLAGAEVEVLGPGEDVELVVADDRWNMVSPTVLGTEGEAELLVVTNTINRGDFWNGQRLHVASPVRVRVRDGDGRARSGVLASGWGQVRALGDA